jgi:flagella basal body P-ring formation protein FlgA
MVSFAYRSLRHQSERFWRNFILTVLQLSFVLPLICDGQTRAPLTSEEVNSLWMSAVEFSIAEIPRFSNSKTSVTFPEKLPNWPLCRQPRAVAGTGSTSTGRFPVNLRCDSPRWVGQIVVQVAAGKRHLVASRNLQAGSVVIEADLSEAESDWTKLPDDVAIDAEQLLGRTLVRGIQQGQAFTLNFVRQTAVIRVGERVRVQMAGVNFTVTGDGVAAQQGAI